MVAYKTVATVAFALLAGCVRPASTPVDYSAMNKQMAEQEAAREACHRDNIAPRFAVIRSRLAHGDPATIEQLADAKRPNVRERQLLIEWANLANRCRIFSDSSYLPNGVPLERFQLTIAALAAGEITYAEYNRRTTELTLIAKDQAAEEARMAAAEARTRAAMAQAQSDAATAALADTVSDAIARSLVGARHRR
jgi:hypothetical protein